MRKGFALRKLPSFLKFYYRAIYTLANIFFLSSLMRVYTWRKELYQEIIMFLFRIDSFVEETVWKKANIFPLSFPSFKMAEKTAVCVNFLCFLFFSFAMLERKITSQNSLHLIFLLSYAKWNENVQTDKNYKRMV